MDNGGNDMIMKYPALIEGYGEREDRSNVSDQSTWVI